MVALSRGLKTAINSIWAKITYYLVLKEQTDKFEPCRYLLGMGRKGWIRQQRK